MEFKIVAVSVNTNAFGLTDMIATARSGETWGVAANHLHLREKGDVITVPYADRPDFSACSFELPHRLPDAPPAMLKRVWGRSTPKQD